MTVKYNKAFQCAKTGECPQTNGEEGCPAWCEVIMTNNQSGELKVSKGCSFQMLPFLITESIKASHIATGTTADIKNEIARGYSLLAQAIPEFVHAIAANSETEDE